MGTIAKRTITTAEATISTATIEVKTITLNNKQMTLSVFRQLQDEDLIDPETTLLRGVPWGKVRYFGNGCESDHLHVVWQKGRELRRACCYEKVERIRPRSPRFARLWDGIQRVAIGYLYALLLSGETRQVAQMFPTRRYAIVSFPGLPDVRVRDIGEGVEEQAIKNIGRLLGWYPYADGEKEAARKDLTEMFPGRSDAEIIAQAPLWAAAKYAEIQAFCAQWKARYQELDALDQLFIAV